MRTKIIGTGSYLPKKIVTNDELSKTLDTNDEWIHSRTGIRARHIADAQGLETGMYMSLQASRLALQMAKLQPSDIDLIVYATVTPDYRLPSNACLLQDALQLKNVPAFDIAAACAGSVYALSIADSFIRSGSYRRVLVVTAEIMSSVVNAEDRNTAVLFGDGASAALLSAHDGNDGFLDFDLYADGSAQKTIYIPKGGAHCPLAKTDLDSHQDKIVMNGRETYKFAVRSMCEAVEKILLDNNLSIHDLAFAVPHQANLRIIEGIASRLNIPLERFLINLDRCANTSAASLLLAYDEASRKGHLKPGDLIIMLAIGAGFVWGASLYRV